MPTPKRTDPFYQAQDILSRRDHSESEVRAKMRRKGFGTDMVEEVVTKFKKIGLINDEKFAVAYTENILLFKPVGSRWIKYKLKQKGIAPTIIDQAIENAFPPGREAELAAQAVRSWRRTHYPPPARHSTPSSWSRGGGDRGGGRTANPNLIYKQRLARYLAARGFSYAAIEFGMNQ